ncbi:MAG TPA: DUF6702 family protein [Chitinophagaceae bacterium]
MASFLNKWLLLSVFPLSVVVGSGLLGLHPFHVSVLEINHNATDKTLEISCKIFTDDFEKVLAKNYNTKVDLINPPNKAAMDTLVRKYLFSHLSIKANGKPVSFSYIGFEDDKEAAYGYIEVENVPSVAKLDIATNMMYDMFEDQVNIMHVIVNGNRKSTKLNFPETETTLSF